MRDAATAMRDAAYAMRDAAYAMRDAECGIGDAASVRVGPASNPLLEFLQWHVSFCRHA